MKTLASLLLFGVAVLAAMPGHAQTSGTNVAAFVAQAESSGCVNNHNPAPNSTASGCFGFTNGTWATYAPQAGVSLAQCPTAASCPISDQFAVFAADVNSNGLADWTCSGCDSTVSNAVNSGQLPASGYNLSINPADYAGLNTASGLQSYFASNGTLPASNGAGTFDLTAQQVDPSAVAGTGAAALPPVNSTPGALSTPFSWVYNQVIAVTQQEVTSDIGAVQGMVNHYLLPLAALSLVVLLLRMLYGRYLIDHAAAWVVKLAIVVPLVAAGSMLYTQFVDQPVFGFPQWWAQYITPSGGQFDISSPAAIFDRVYTAAAATQQAIWNGTHGLINTAEAAISLLVAKGLMSVSLAVLFIPFAVLTLLSDGNYPVDVARAMA